MLRDFCDLIIMQFPVIRPVISWFFSNISESNSSSNLNVHSLRATRSSDSHLYFDLIEPEDELQVGILKCVLVCVFELFSL